MDGFSPPTSYDQQGWAQFGADSALHVFFFLKPLHNKFKSAEAGTPIYDPVEFVHIQQPGEKDYVERPAEGRDIERFQRHYNLFKQGMEQIPDGTPIDLLFPNAIEIAAQLRHQKIFTVQQLANLSEEAITRVGLGGRQWVQSAKQYIGQAAGGAEYHKLKGELEHARSKMEVQEQQIAALSRAVEQMQANAQMAMVPRVNGPSMVQMPMPNQPVLNGHADAADAQAYYGQPAQPEEYAMSAPAEPAPIRRGPGRPRKQPFGG